MRDRAQVNYLAAFVGDEAVKYLQHYTDKNGADIIIKGVWTYLDVHYKDYYRVQRALAKYKRFKQDNKAFPEFIAELNRLQSEAAIDD